MAANRRQILTLHSHLALVGADTRAKRKQETPVEWRTVSVGCRLVAPDCTVIQSAVGRQSHRI